MPNAERRRSMPGLSTGIAATLALTLGLGWLAREVAFARERAAVLKSVTLPVESVKMVDAHDKGQLVGHNGVYLSGDTPASTNFVTGRFVIEPGKSPHAPHTHIEEEVMIVESGAGEIFCDGKTTKVGPGSVMYTTPQAPHAIVNNGDKPLVFYYVKWAGKPGA